MPTSRFSTVSKIVNGNPFVHVSPARAAAIKPGLAQAVAGLARAWHVLSGKGGRLMARSW
jgi:hypothetical protein